MSEIAMLHSGTFIGIVTNNRTVLQPLAKPRLQSGQMLLRMITDLVHDMIKTGVQMQIYWLPTHDSSEGIIQARQHARQNTTPRPTGNPPPWATTRLKSAAWRVTCQKFQKLETVQFTKSRGGIFTRTVDAALPGKHTKLLYDNFSRKEASVLAQLRTGHPRLNAFLYDIQRADSEMCTCEEGKESVQHFLFECKRWDHLRQDIIRAMGPRFNDLSYALGGRSNQVLPDGNPVDGDVVNWKPNLEVVKSVLKFAIKTGRL